MSKPNNRSKYDPRMGLQLYASSGMLLFSGLILGALLMPWGFEGMSQSIVIFVGSLLFVGGYVIQRQREKKIETDTNAKFTELERRIKTLENQLNTRSDGGLEKESEQKLESTKTDYDPRKNLEEGIKSLLRYHRKNFALLITYISIVSVNVFNYDLFGFSSNMPNSIPATYLVFILIIAFSALIHLMREALDKIRMETTHKTMAIFAYPSFVFFIIAADLVFFTIHWVSDGVHALGLTLPVGVENQIFMALVLTIFWLPTTEVIFFHSMKLREWVCGRDKYLDELESK